MLLRYRQKKVVVENELPQFYRKFAYLNVTIYVKVSGLDDTLADSLVAGIIR